ncbi:hypothetical protein FACS189467_8300 [Bacteroidia bacterium]|nr:hypothetical protein FACS189467_8300 [Bacteroidia bacterium]
MLIDVTEAGMLMLVSPVQLEKAEVPIDVTELGMFTLVSPVQLKKALSPIDVTVLGIVYVVPCLPGGYCTRVVLALLKKTPSTEQ